MTGMSIMLIQVFITLEGIELDTKLSKRKKLQYIHIYELIMMEELF